MDRTITITESELDTIVRASVRAFAQELGIKPRRVQGEWISFNQATKIDPKAFGRKKLETAINLKLVRTRAKNHDKVNGVRYVNRRDVEYMIKNTVL